MERWEDPGSLLKFLNQCTRAGPSLPPVSFCFSVLYYETIIILNVMPVLARSSLIIPEWIITDTIIIYKVLVRVRGENTFKMQYIKIQCLTYIDIDSG